MKLFLHRSWVEIDLDHLAHNLLEIRKLLRGAELMAVVKADAYGHGSAITALTLERAGADSFGVSNINEAEVLRKIGVKKPILVLGFTPPENADRLAELRLIQTVMSQPYGEELSRAAKQAGVTLPVHIKVDTGMSRLGFFAKDQETAEHQIESVCHLDNLEARGIFTHFAVADEAETPFGREFTEAQHIRFAALVSRLSQRGLSFDSVHCCNSAGTAFFPEFHHSLVRVGILLYGLSPTGRPIEGLDLRPVMALKSSVTQVKQLPAGECVSYGCTYTTDKDRTIAVAPLGYADGYPRRLGNKAKAYINGRLVPIVGTICMDQMMLDVTGLDVRQDDIVTFFGDDSPISLANLAGLSGTISYELCCGISRRVPRVYLKNGEILDAVDYTL